jgi:hypothetical protein
MKFTYAVTFEFDTAPPLTARGDVEATLWHVAAARAIRWARKSHPGQSASSMVVLLARTRVEALPARTLGIEAATPSDLDATLAAEPSDG